MTKIFPSSAPRRQPGQNGGARPGGDTVIGQTSGFGPPPAAGQGAVQGGPAGRAGRWAALSPLASRRGLLALVTLTGFGLVAFGVLLQEFADIEPCPLCILQRYLFILVALLAVPGVVAPVRWGRVAAFLALIACLAGAATSIRHLYLQWNPPEWASCLPGLDVMMEQMPLASLLPKIFHGGGECTEIHKFLGLSIPGWALLWFAVLGVLAGFALRRRT